MSAYIPGCICYSYQHKLAMQFTAIGVLCRLRIVCPLRAVVVYLGQRAINVPGGNSPGFNLDPRSPFQDINTYPERKIGSVSPEIFTVSIAIRRRTLHIPYLPFKAREFASQGVQIRVRENPGEPLQNPVLT
jgi:hypothetical protein